MFTLKVVPLFDVYPIKNTTICLTPCNRAQQKARPKASYPHYCRRWLWETLLLVMLSRLWRSLLSQTPQTCSSKSPKKHSTQPPNPLHPGSFITVDAAPQEIYLRRHKSTRPPLLRLRTRARTYAVSAFTAT